MAVWRSNIVAQEQTPDNLRAALVHTPDDATRWRALGIAVLETEAYSAERALRKAIELNPFETDAFIGLALQAEVSGKASVAEDLYRRATVSSRRFRPAYAFAAFYARSGRLPEFWKAASAAAAIDKADVGRIIRLAQDTSVDPNAVPDLLNLKAKHALHRYLETAVAKDSASGMAEAALRLPVTSDNHQALADACNRLIEGGATAQAIRVWNHLQPFPGLDVPGGRSLTNPRFVSNPVQGFDWRIHRIPGIEVRPGVAGIQVAFSGDQPEHGVVLDQVVPVLPNRSYRLTVQYEAAETSTTAGLAWHARCLSSGELLSTEAVANSPAVSTSLAMRVPARCELVGLMFAYNRKPGTVRITGMLHLRSATLDLLP